MYLKYQRPNFSTIMIHVGLTSNVKMAEVFICKKVYFILSTLYLMVYLVVFFTFFRFMLNAGGSHDILLLLATSL